MQAYKCDDCGKLFEKLPYRGAYYSIRDGVGTFYNLDGKLNLCGECWNKMLKKVFKDMEIKNE